MKKLYILLLITPLLSCGAQTIVPYDSDESIFVPNSGDYYKDTNNDFNIYEGEWKWENIATNSELRFAFKKEVNIDDGINDYTYDLLVGEYIYIYNGLELANTLININNTNVQGNSHKITGVNFLTKYNTPQCDECTENEKRIDLTIQHDNYDGVFGKIILRYFVENGIEKLKVLVKDGAWLSQDPSAPDDIDIPFGEYIMVKQ